jgi:radical SAM protein with 4Fe4S-binding SPASM domain
MTQTSDPYGIDDHKLHYHVRRVSDWLQGKNIYPVYMEISPSGACNHRCTFCGLDFMEYKARFLDPEILKVRLTELGKLGLKSIMYAGEGEPFLHKDMPDIAVHTKKSGIDVAFTTNGVLMTPEKQEVILPVTKWIKVSCNAGSPATYTAIHRSRKDDFNKVIKNLENAVRLRMQNNYSCTLGLQMVLLPENQSEAGNLATICRDIGLDYLVIKPYSQHSQGESKIYESISYENSQNLVEELAPYYTKNFQVIVRTGTMQRWDSKNRDYKKCQALPFWSYIDSSGNVWGCSVYLGDDRFLYGNIFKQPFKEIWESEKRKISLQVMEECFDPENCRINCRMDKINSFLWKLKHPPQHVNFI